MLTKIRFRFEKTKGFQLCCMKLMIVVLVIAGVSVENSHAQDEDLPAGVVAPPISVLSEKEKESLEEEKSLKKRTKLALNLMDRRLVKSAVSADDAEYQESLDQLGFFRAIMDSTLVNLEENDYRKNILGNYKRFEIALRGFIPRLENVRRALPASHSYHVSQLIESVRNARQIAIESFYGDTVISDGRLK